MIQMAKVTLGVALGILLAVAVVAGVIVATAGNLVNALSPGVSLVATLSPAPAVILSRAPDPRPVTPAEVPTSQPLANVAAPALAPTSKGQLLDYEDVVVGVYESALPSVVGVMVRQPTSGPIPRAGAGSGIIVSDKGLVLTNNHVVSGVDTATISLSDGREFDAKVLGRDTGNDLALLKISGNPSGLRPAKLGDSDKVKVGQVAIAIGSPFGLEGSLTAGIISSLGRSRIGGTNRPMRDMIQTDTAINPGNSGGPLLNARGEVIGINAVIESPVRGSVGIGFAVPINAAKRVLSKLEAGAKISHPWLGISGLPLNNRLAEQLGLTVQKGVYIIGVVEKGPADQAGLRAASRTSGSEFGKGGDVVVEVDGRTISSVDDVGSYIDRKEVGDKVTLKVLRDGKETTLTVELGEWPETPISQ